jgi:uncharacterized protein (TIGR03382 family)
MEWGWIAGDVAVALIVAALPVLAVIARRRR